MAKSKITEVKFNKNMENWLKDNANKVVPELRTLGGQLLSGSGAGGKYEVQIVERQVDAGLGRKDRPVANLVAKEGAGWKELREGSGPLHQITAMRKRITGPLKVGK